MIQQKIIWNLNKTSFFYRLWELIIFLFISSSSTAFAQVKVAAEPNALDNFEIISMMDRVNTNWIQNDMEEPIDGSPYLKEEFKKGEIVLIDNTILSDVLLRYNIYNDEIEYQNKGINYIIGTKHLVKNLKLEDEIFVVDIYKSSIGEKQGYFTMLADGEVKLLRKYTMELTDRVPAKAMRDPEPRKFVRQKDLFFIKVRQQNVYEFSSVKKLIEFLGDHQDELKSFVKKEKISSRNPRELTKFIDYYNTL